MLELESRVMKRLSYLSKTYKNPATNGRHMNETRPFERRDSDRGSKFLYVLLIYSFSDLEDFFILQVQIRRRPRLLYTLDFVLQPMLQEQAQAPQLQKWIGSYILFTQTDAKLENKSSTSTAECPGSRVFLLWLQTPGYWNHLFPSILASDLA